MAGAAVVGAAAGAAVVVEVVGAGVAVVCASAAPPPRARAPAKSAIRDTVANLLTMVWFLWFQASLFREADNPKNGPPGPRSPRKTGGILAAGLWQAHGHAGIGFGRVTHDVASRPKPGGGTGLSPETARSIVSVVGITHRV